MNVPTLSSSAMLVDISLSVWTAHKLDRGVTAEVNNAKHAQAGVARVNKNLFKGVYQLEDIKKYSSEVRNWVYRRTLPWADNGSRLLPTEAFFDFKAELDKRRDHFDDLVDTLIKSYPTLISAQAFKLGSLFDVSEYPTPQQVRTRFGFNVSFSPLPEAGDFRVDIGTEAQEELEAQYKDLYDERFATATADIKDRLLNSIRHLSERLEYGDDGKKKVFAESTLQNIVDMVQQVKVLNISQDELLDAASLEAERVLATTSVKELRKEDDARDETKRKLDEILAKFAV